MNKLIPLSLLCLVIIIAGVIWTKTRIDAKYSKPAYSAILDKLDNIKQLSIQSSKDVQSAKELRFKSDELKSSVAEAHSADNQQAETQAFWVKVAFSAVFCLAALFVVLSNKYDADTKKWAFSVLSLISGIWIGTLK